MGREGIVSRVERPSVSYPWHLDKSSRLRHCFEQLRRIVGRAVPIQRGELSLDDGAGRQCRLRKRHGESNWHFAICISQSRLTPRASRPTPHASRSQAPTEKAHDFPFVSLSF